MKITCGIDWSERHHDVALADENGGLVAKRRIAESVEGFNELLTMLAEAGDTAEDLIPIAIETPRGLLVTALRAAGRKVYSISEESGRFYQRKRAEGKRRTQAVLALARRRVNVLWAMLRDHRCYEPIPPTASTT